MTYPTKLARARAIIEAYNASAPSKIDFGKFEDGLKALGAVNDETMAMVSWEDLQGCGLPKLLARQIAAEFRAKSDDEPNHYPSAKKVGRMSFEELLSAYDPDPVTGSGDVARRLTELSKGKRFIVFADGKVHVATSVVLLKELCRGMAEVAMWQVDGKPCKTYKIGERPDMELDQNPIWANRPLRSDETCDQTLRSWRGVPLVVRQLVLLAISKTHELKVASVSDAHDIMDRCTMPNTDPEAMLRGRCPKAALMLDELIARQNAPRLKLVQGAPVTNDPFGSAP